MDEIALRNIGRFMAVKSTHSRSRLIDHFVVHALHSLKSPKRQNLEIVKGVLLSKFGVRLHERELRESRDRLKSKGKIIEGKGGSITLEGATRREAAGDLRRFEELKDKCSDDLLRRFDTFVEVTEIPDGLKSKLHGIKKDVNEVLFQYYKDSAISLGIESTEFLTQSQIDQASPEPVKLLQGKLNILDKPLREIVFDFARLYTSNTSNIQIEFFNLFASYIFTYYLLSVDTDLQKYLKGESRSLSLILDTTVILGNYSDYTSRIAGLLDELLDSSNYCALRTEFLYTTNTQHEIQNGIESSQTIIQYEPWEAYQSREAIAMHSPYGIVSEFHWANIKSCDKGEGPISPGVFFARMRHIEREIKGKGAELTHIDIERIIEDPKYLPLRERYKQFLYEKRPAVLERKSDTSIAHDIVELLFIIEQREADLTDFWDARTFLVTTDASLGQFEQYEKAMARPLSGIKICLSPSVVAQIIRPFYMADKASPNLLSSFNIAQYLIAPGADKINYARQLLLESVRRKKLPEELGTIILNSEYLHNKINKNGLDWRDVDSLVNAKIVEANKQLRKKWEAEKDKVNGKERELAGKVKHIDSLEKDLQRLESTRDVDKLGAEERENKLKSRMRDISYASIAAIAILVIILYLAATTQSAIKFIIGSEAICLIIHFISHWFTSKYAPKDGGFNKVVNNFFGAMYLVIFSIVIWIWGT